MRYRLLLLVALLVPSVAHADELTRPSVVFLAAAAADGITTYRTLSAFQSCDRANVVPYCGGARRERNFLIAPLKSPGRIVAGGAALDIASLLIARKVGKRHPKLVKVLMYSAAAYRGFLASRNEITLQQSLTYAAAKNAIYGAR
jgi:hypothetical protein